jgi:chromosome segregation ATPase
MSADGNSDAITALSAQLAERDAVISMMKDKTRSFVQKLKEEHQVALDAKNTELEKSASKGAMMIDKLKELKILLDASKAEAAEAKKEGDANHFELKRHIANNEMMAAKLKEVMGNLAAAKAEIEEAKNTATATNGSTSTDISKADDAKDAELKRHVANNEMMAARLKELKTTLDATNSDLAQARHDAEAAKKEAHTEIMKAVGATETLANENAAWSKDTVALKNEVKTLQAQKEEHDSAMKTANASKEALTAQLQDLQKQHDAQVAPAREREKALNLKLAEITSAKALAERELENAKQQMSKMEATAAAAATDDTNNSERLMKEGASKFTAMVAQKDAELRELQKQSDAREKAAVETGDARVLALQGENMSKIKAFQSDSETKFKELTAEHDAKLRSLREEASAKIRALQEEVKTGHTNSVQSAEASAKAATLALAREKEMREASETMQTTIAQLQEQLVTQKEEFDRAVKETSADSADKQSLEKKCEVLQRDLVEMRTFKEEGTKQITLLGQDKDALQRELSNVKTDRDRVAAQLMNEEGRMNEMKKKMKVFVENLALEKEAMSKLAKATEEELRIANEERQTLRAQNTAGDEQMRCEMALLKQQHDAKAAELENVTRLMAIEGATRVQLQAQIESVRIPFYCSSFLFLFVMSLSLSFLSIDCSQLAFSDTTTCHKSNHHPLLNQSQLSHYLFNTTGTRQHKTGT